MIKAALGYLLLVLIITAAQWPTTRRSNRVTFWINAVLYGIGGLLYMNLTVATQNSPIEWIYDLLLPLNPIK